VSHFWRPLLKQPYYVSIHASEILDDFLSVRRIVKWVFKWWRLIMLRQAKGIFPVSRYSAQIAVDSGIDPQQIHIVTNGVNINRFRCRDVQEKSGDWKMLCTVARLDLHKGHDRVLEALALLKRKGLTPRYVIAGEGDEMQRLKNVTSSLGLTGQVEFLGFVPDEQLPSLYAHSDIYVMPSREIPGRLDLIEGFGISFLEASACGIPVVAGRSGGVSDAVKDGESGFLVDPDSSEDIARACETLLKDENLARKMGLNGRRWVEREMTWDHVAQRMIEVMKRDQSLKSNGLK
jgi:phosphatidylinositol alpha-1,6-mannosyltransferase